MGTAALGQSLLGNIDQDVYKGLLLMAMPDKSPVISPALPKELASVRMPVEFTWIGSLERRMDAVIGTGITQTMASWRTLLPPDAARARAVEAMTAQGWEAVQGFSGMSVFVGSDPSIAQSVCRENQPIAVSANRLDDVTYVLFALTRGNQNSICNSQMRPMMGMDTSLDPYLPKLLLPVDPATGQPASFQSGGSGSRGTGRSFSTGFATSASAVEVANHFAAQMAEQGWSRDVSWNGDSTAGSAWFRQPDAGTTVQASLQVTAMGDERVQAVLHVVKRK